MPGGETISPRPPNDRRPGEFRRVISDLDIYRAACIYAELARRALHARNLQRVPLAAMADNLPVCPSERPRISGGPGTQWKIGPTETGLAV